MFGESMRKKNCCTCGKVVFVESRYANKVRCDDCKGITNKVGNTDTDDLVYCRICNLLRRRLDSHIKSDHKMTVEQYLQQYSNAPIYANNTIKGRQRDEESRARTSRALLRNWANEEARKKRVEIMLKNPTWKGKKLSEEHKRNLSISVHNTKSQFRQQTLDRRKVKRKQRKSELKEFIICPLCLKETNDEIASRVGLITRSHLKKHNYTRKQFLQEYPGYILSRDDQRLIWEQNFDISNYNDIIFIAKECKLQDLNDKIYCRYCLKFTKRISARHLDKHKITIQMYQKLFPSAPLVTDDVVQRSTKIIAESLCGKEMMQNRGVGGCRKDIGHYVRSMIEANFCRILKLNNIVYKYEPQSFILNHEQFHAYIPDLLLLNDFEQWSSNSYIELKHTIGDESYKKMVIFRQQYPDKVINFLAKRSQLWKDLERKYKHLIPLWETGIQNIKTMPSLYV